MHRTTIAAASILALVGSLGAGQLDSVDPVAASDPVDTMSMDAVAPDFELTDINGKAHRLYDYLDQGKTVVLEWFNPTCVFVERHHGDLDTIRSVHEAHKGDERVVWLAINSGCVESRTAGRQVNASYSRRYRMKYPVLLDTDGAVGQLYSAKVTPEFVVVSPDRSIAYRGAIDDQPSLRPDAKPSRNHLAEAMDELLAGESVSVPRTRAYGCFVKYKSEDGYMNGHHTPDGAGASVAP